MVQVGEFQRKKKRIRPPGPGQGQVAEAEWSPEVPVVPELFRVHLLALPHLACPAVAVVSRYLKPLNSPRAAGQLQAQSIGLSAVH